jgi:hypothetical protein
MQGFGIRGLKKKWIFLDSEVVMHIIALVLMVLQMEEL